MNKKGDLKIQEMAFVLLALAVLGAMIFIFTIRFQSENIASTAEGLDQQRALSLRDRIVALPELKCAGKSCIDIDKAKLIDRYDTGDLFQGLVAASVVPIYPEGEEIVLYQSGEEIQRSYSTFTNLCKQTKIGTAFDYECSLALLLVSV